ncbi:hypothetical protein C8D87_105526 [Lentzea atacamensis]|uniref:Uncharacterized protein n=1 Tax=Lentzea atacamensis TaxID=531938 RepID=A0ABX9E749_9PSEU|nr:hypothetical protein C8D87_105526 [Lentzea atacamensis]
MQKLIFAAGWLARQMADGAGFDKANAPRAPRFVC